MVHSRGLVGPKQADHWVVARLDGLQHRRAAESVGGNGIRSGLQEHLREEGANVMVRMCEREERRVNDGGRSAPLSLTHTHTHTQHTHTLHSPWSLAHLAHLHQPLRGRHHEGSALVVAAGGVGVYALAQHDLDLRSGSPEGHEEEEEEKD